MGRIEYLIGKTVDARQNLLEHKMSCEGYNSILHLVPTKGRVIELETDPELWLKRRIITLTGLIYRIFETDIRQTSYNGFRPLEENLRYLIIKKAIEKRGTQPDGLTFFHRLLDKHHQGKDFKGVYKTIAGFFSLLIRNNYQDMFAHDMAGRMIRLEQRSPGAGEEMYALESDLTWLFGEYEEIKREIKIFDEDDVISSVRQFLKQGETPSLLKGVDVLIFDGFIQLSRIEEDILFCLFNLVDKTWWLVDYDSRVKDPVRGFKDSSGREQKGGWKDKGSEKVARKGSKEAYRVFVSLVSLMDGLEESGEEQVEIRAEEKDYPNPVADGLYMGGLLKEKGEENLKIKSFSGEVDEVRAIAGEIKRIIREHGLDVSGELGNIRVIFPDLNDYSSIIQEIFREYGIPFSLTKGLPLFSHPVSNLFLDIFRLPVNHFNIRDILNLFCSDLIQANLNNRDWCLDQLPFIPKELLLPGDCVRDLEKFTGKGVDIFLFDKVAKKCGLQYLGDDLSGLKPRSLKPVRGFFLDRYVRSKYPEDKENTRLEYYGFIFQAVLMSKILNPFLKLADQDDPENLSRVYLDLLHRLWFPQNVVNVPEGQTGMDTCAVEYMIKKDIKAYSILRDLISSCAKELLFANELFTSGTGKELLSEFYSVFRNRLNSAYLLDERNPNVVRVSQWLETRGRSFDYVFAGGMTSDRFPLREEMDFILPESPDRAFRLFDNVDLCKHLFSHVLKNNRKKLYISYPRFREEKPLQPSQVLVDLESMVKNSKAPEKTIEDIFKWEDNPYLTSKQEMLDSSVTKNRPGANEQSGPFKLKEVVIHRDASSEGLIRGISSMFCRSAVDGLFEYDGMVSRSSRFSEFLKEKHDSFSASQLESLANCPMHYLFEYVYGLKPMEELGPEPSPVDRGDYLHAILAAIFRRLKEQGKNVSDIGLAQAFSMAMEATEDYFIKRPFLKRLEFFESQEKELLAGLEQNASKPESNEGEGILATLLRFEEENLMDRLPGGIEYQFGYNGPQTSMGKISLKGYIDRFDLDRHDKNMLYIYDYKTGRSDPALMVKKGLSFQLPVYIRALKSGPYNGKKISASIYSIKQNDLVKKEPFLQTINDHYPGSKGLDISGVKLIDEYVDRLMENLKMGYFHHSADRSLCDYCEFKHACHMDSRRMDYLLDSHSDQRIYSGKKNLKKWENVLAFRKEWKKVLKSMGKAVELQTETARKKHFDYVMDFKARIGNDIRSLPFYEEYIQELILEIEKFEKEYSLKSIN